MQKEHAAGRTRPACAGHPPRARTDRTTDCARTGSMLPGSGKTFIDAALAYGAKDRRIAPLRGLGGRDFDRHDQLRDHRCNRQEDRVERRTTLWRRSRGGNCRGSWLFTAWRTWHNMPAIPRRGVQAAELRHPTPGKPLSSAPPPPQDVRYHGTALAWAGTNTFVASLLLGGDCDDGPDIRGKKADI